jgi:N-acetylglucosamine-6-sulfatase
VGYDITTMPRSTALAGRASRVLAIVLTGMAVGTLTLPAEDQAKAPTSPKPNILFVLTDDQDLATLADMPQTLKVIGRQGATFDNAFVSDSLCCPSRTTILRGQYAHNTGVLSNGGGNGGFQTAYASGIENDTIATRLQDAGYETGLFGKYLNKYPGSAGRDYVPPGWSSWASPVSGRPYEQYDYVLNEDGVAHSYDHAPSDYGTDVYMDLAQQFIKDSVHDDQPFFAYVSLYAPHLPAIPAPEDTARFASRRAPRTPTFDQADVSRMPAFIRGLPQFTPREDNAIDRLYRRRIRSLQAIDRGVARLVKTLRRVGQLDNTYIVFTSDNGYHLGQHRLPAGKATAYDTDIRVPLLIRGPGVAAGVHLEQFVGNVDFAPTFAAIARASAIPFADGRSLLGLLHGHHPRHWRNAELVEHWDETRKDGAPQPPHGRLDPDDASEPDDADELAGDRPNQHTNPTRLEGPGPLSDQTVLARFARIPAYTAIRTSRYLYVEYAGGERELYDLIADPDEADNLAGRKKADVEARLAERLGSLRACRGRGCRKADE